MLSEHPPEDALDCIDFIHPLISGLTIVDDDGVLNRKTCDVSRLSARSAQSRLKGVTNWARHFRGLEIEIHPVGSTISEVTLRLYPVDVPECEWVLESSIAWGDDSVHDLLIVPYTWRAGGQLEST